MRFQELFPLSSVKLWNYVPQNLQRELGSHVREGTVGRYLRGMLDAFTLPSGDLYGKEMNLTRRDASNLRRYLDNAEVYFGRQYSVQLKTSISRLMWEYARHSSLKRCDEGSMPREQLPLRYLYVPNTVSFFTAIRFGEITTGDVIADPNLLDRFSGIRGEKKARILKTVHEFVYYPRKLI